MAFKEAGIVARLVKIDSGSISLPVSRLFFYPRYLSISKQFSMDEYE